MYVWAKANNVIVGYDDGRFGGEDPIKREQTVAILWRYSNSPAVEAGRDFTDESSISAYAAQAVDWSRANGVVSGNSSEPDMHDIGILASTDSVALDQTCTDLVYAQKDGDGASLVNRIESRNGLHTLEHAKKSDWGARVTS